MELEYQMRLALQNVKQKELTLETFDMMSLLLFGNGFPFPSLFPRKREQRAESNQKTLHFSHDMLKSLFTYILFYNG